MRQYTSVRVPALLVAMAMAGVLSCKVDIEDVNWDALPSDPGVVQDLGGQSDPGQLLDDGERPDTTVLKDPGTMDPGTTEDPGVGTDPGTVEDPGTPQDTFEDIPFVPCSQTFNPSCTPAACDDEDPKTVNDQCVMGEDAHSNPVCKCVGSAIPIDPCQGLASEMCVDVGCDDGDVRTQPDNCRWGTNDDGVDACLCAGVPGLNDACASDLNPKCSASKCLAGRLIPGRCGKGGPLERCACIPTDPCGQKLNPQCSAEQCVSSAGTLGICATDLLLGCICKNSTLDPCTTRNNKVCSAMVCLRSGKLGFGQCSPAEGGCSCGAVDARGPCGSYENPQCKPDDCPLGGGRTGQCRATLTGMCMCDEGAG